MTYTDFKAWTVLVPGRARKQVGKLPRGIQDRFDLLAKELEVSGPIRRNWKNFSRLRIKGEIYHCHLKSGHPTYVACWAVTDKERKILEVYYVGTHENAPY